MSTGDETQRVERRLGSAIDSLAEALWGRLDAGGANLAFSPASIALALAMTASGARGDTQRELLGVLHVGVEGVPRFGDLARELGRKRTGSVAIALAHRMFGARGYPFDQEFVRLLDRQFGAPLELLAIEHDPEGARRHVNEWVARQTEGRIVDLLPERSVAADTRMLIANAISFLGEWRLPFAKEATRPGPFRTRSGRVADVATMHAEARLEVADAEGCTAVELAYKGGAFVMLFVLPPADDPLAVWDARRFRTLVAALRPEEVALALPRFAVEAPRTLRLRPALEALGASRMFDPARADLTGIADPPDPTRRIVVTEVWHKAFVRVDEKGTEAAAATVVGGAEGAMPRPRPREVRFDRPFWFVLRHVASGVPLFVGRLVDPGV